MMSVLVASVAVVALLLTALVLVLRGVVRFSDPPWVAQVLNQGPSRIEADLLARVGALEARLARLEAERSGRPRTAPADPETAADRRTDAGQVWRPDRRAARREAEPVLIAVPDLASTGVRDAAEALAEFDRRFGDVWGLADQGLADDEIAARTGYPAGQVELILGLRRQAGAPPMPGAGLSGTPPDHPPRGDDAHA